MKKLRRRFQRDPTEKTKEGYSNARSKYSYAIRAAKTKMWKEMYQYDYAKAKEIDKIRGYTTKIRKPSFFF